MLVCVHYLADIVELVALARVQRMHEPADLWDITFSTR